MVTILYPVHCHSVTLQDRSDVVSLGSSHSEHSAVSLTNGGGQHRRLAGERRSLEAASKPGQNGGIVSK